MINGHVCRRTSQCAITDLNASFLPKQMTTTGVKITMNWNLPRRVSLLTKKYLKVFFRLTIYFSGTIFFFQGTTFVQFFMYCKTKKNFGAIRKILKIFVFENYFIKKVRKGGFQLMLILDLLVVYFDAVVVFVTSQTLLFRLALDILWDI